VNKRKGKQTVFFEVPPIIRATGTVAGKKEGEGPIGKCFDFVTDDALFNEKTWEKAESKFVKTAVSAAIKNANLEPEDIDYLLGGDLINQCTGTTYGIRDFAIPYFGLYGACSTMALSLSLASICIDGGFAKRCAAVTSSHFCSAEKQFRFPLEYGGQRPPSAQWTVTGSACAILEQGGTLKEGVKIEGITTGKIIDKGITDANSMGAAMAPAAADTLITHFKETGRKPSDYDIILSGDLGKVGKSIVIDMVGEAGYDLSQNYNDCGLIIFDGESQDTHSGGSGCACAGLTFCGYIYKLLKEKNIENVLFMATGALQSTLAIQQGESIPGIAHALSIHA